MDDVKIIRTKKGHTYMRLRFVGYDEERQDAEIVSWHRKGYTTAYNTMEQRKVEGSTYIAYLEHPAKMDVELVFPTWCAVGVGVGR